VLHYVAARCNILNFDVVRCSGTAPHVVVCVHICMYVCICDVCINMPLYKLYIRVWCVCLCVRMFMFVCVRASASACVRMNVSQRECMNVQLVTHHPSLVTAHSTNRCFTVRRRPIHIHTHAQTHKSPHSVMIVIDKNNSRQGIYVRMMARPDRPKTKTNQHILYLHGPC